MVWKLWGLWAPVWTYPWVAVTTLLVIALIFSIPWKVRVLPFTLAYLWCTSSLFVHDPKLFVYSPSTLDSLLAFVAFLVFLRLREPEFMVRRWKLTAYPLMLVTFGLIGFIASCCLWTMPERYDANYLMPIYWNRSMGGCLTVLSLAPTLLMPLGLISAILLGRTTPIIVFAVYWVTRRNSFWRLYVVGVLALIFVANFPLPTDSGRMHFWQTFHHFWVNVSLQTKLFGAHLGSVAADLPVAQISAGLKDSEQVFIWLHNDFYQALVEFGIIGFMLCVIAGIEIFLKCKREQRALMIAMCVAMLTNFPWHWMPEAFVYWYFIKKNAVCKIKRCTLKDARLA